MSLKHLASVGVVALTLAVIPFATPIHASSTTVTFTGEFRHKESCTSVPDTDTVSMTTADGIALKNVTHGIATVYVDGQQTEYTIPMNTSRVIALTVGTWTVELHPACRHEHLIVSPVNVTVTEAPPSPPTSAEPAPAVPSSSPPVTPSSTREAAPSAGPSASPTPVKSPHSLVAVAPASNLPTSSPADVTGGIGPVSASPDSTRAPNLDLTLIATICVAGVGYAALRALWMQLQAARLRGAPAHRARNPWLRAIRFDHAGDHDARR